MSRLPAAARLAADWVDLQLSLVVEALERLAPRARGRLLDVGCGDRPYEHLFTPFVDSYTGVEHEASFSLTSASARALGGKGPDVLYDGLSLPFDDESFETVLCAQVLEHTPRPARLMAEMARVLSPEGLLILTAPFSFRLHEEPHDYFRFSPHALRELCDEAGLEVLEIAPQGSLWSLLGHKLNSFLALRVARLGAVGQRLGKLGHEAEPSARPRLWALPAVAPTLLAVAASARLLDRLLPDPTEALGFSLLAKKRPSR